MIKISWTKHAEERALQWYQRLEITREEVESVVINPQ